MRQHTVPAEVERLLESLRRGDIDLVVAATEARAIFAAAGDAVRNRWLDLEIGGYDAVTDVRPLHEVLGVPVGDRLAVQVASYRAQLGRRWSGPAGQTQFAHFFVEPLAELVAAQDRARDAPITNFLELSFAPPASAPEYPTSGDFPPDVFDRVLFGFRTTLELQLRELAP
jgi:hypothetical protein